MILVNVQGCCFDYWQIHAANFLDSCDFMSTQVIYAAEIITVLLYQEQFNITTTEVTLELQVREPGSNT